MLRTRASAALVILAALSALSLTQSVAPGVVTRVIDGDTIVVSGIGTVRLIGVDTPETVDPRKPIEHFGQEASAFLTQFVFRQTVRLEFEGARKDKYDRTLAYVYRSDGTLLNAEIIRLGYGHAYTAFPFSKMEEFRAVQREAMANNRGLWAAGVERAIQPGIERTAEPEVGRVTQPAAAPATQPSDAKPASIADATVYATRTGAKYHRAGCRYLARSQIPLTLKEASACYGPCSICGPPVLQGDATPASAAPRAEPPRPAASSGRCQATTKRGTQCSRNAQPGRSYCWQH